MKLKKKNISAYRNFLMAQREMAAGEVSVQSYPYILCVDPTSICQLRCPTCPTGIENESRKPARYRERTHMKVEMFSSLLDEVGDYLFLIMLYNWGEPFLNKDLPRLIELSNKRDICTEIHTNLSLPLDDDYLERVLASGVDVVAASLDGFSQESYMQYRRGGDFNLAKQNIEKLARIRDARGLKTQIIWNFLVFSFNEDELHAAKDFCKQIGIEFCRREAFISNPDWLPSYRKEDLKEDSTSFAAPHITHNATNRCGWHYCYSIVNANGSISPCCAPWEQDHDFGKMELGSIGFHHIWNNDHFRKSRGLFSGKETAGLDNVKTICSSCPFGDYVQTLYSSWDTSIRKQMNSLFSTRDLDMDKTGWFGNLLRTFRRSR